MTLTDPFGREIRYLRLSVTDRCDLRCDYCMPKAMTFLPKKDVLSVEELDRLATQFIELGVRKLRLTGGEPLVRRGFDILLSGLSRHIESGALDELTLTTNGTLLERDAQMLADNGVKRINVSLDTIDPEDFRALTRGGDLSRVLAGLTAAEEAGLKIKINAVALKRFEGQIEHLMKFAHGRGYDLTLIEVMPMGEIGRERADDFVSLLAVREGLEQKYTLTPLPDRTGGPARYVRVEETGGRLGLITPLTGNFCDGCNRVRLTCTGKLYQCLGQDQSTNFLALMRAGANDDQLREAIIAAIARKPLAHDFDVSRGAGPSVARTMSLTGG